jgi:hypothetical protein
MKEGRFGVKKLREELVLEEWTEPGDGERRFSLGMCRCDT